MHTEQIALKYPCAYTNITLNRSLILDVQMPEEASVV